MTFLTELTGLLWPVRCPGCGTLDVPWCARCRRWLDGDPWPAVVEAWPGGPPVWVRAEYAGVLPRVVVAWKDRGRHDLTRPLAPGLAGSCAAALSHHGFPPGSALQRRSAPAAVHLVTVPSSRANRRRRGADVVADLARGAAGHLGEGVLAAPVLRHRRAVRDQSGLGAGHRRANLEGALELGPGSRVAGWCVVIVDDVVTTGASVTEAARVLTAGGAHVLGIAALAATPRRT